MVLAVGVHSGSPDAADGDGVLIEEPGAHRIRVVVEDDPAVRLLVQNVLTELGYSTHAAEDANTALRLLESELRIDLLVTDVGLPGMNGRQLAEIARQHRPELKVLFMTGYAQQAAERQGFLDEGMDLLAKPFTLEQLAGKIRQMIRPAGGYQA